MNYECLILEKRDGIVKLVLNRPRVMNALSNQLIAELKAAFDDIRGDDDIQVVIITGAGRAFCAGRDLKDVGTEKPAVTGDEVCSAIENLDKPVIAAVNGYCYTAGLELILSCDMIIASENAVFADTHTRYGLVHGWGGSQRLPRLVGSMRAKEIMFTSGPISAQEADRIGLVNKVVPQNKLEEITEELATKITKNDRSSVAIIKSIVNRGMKLNLAEAIEFEAAEHKKYRGAGLPTESQRRVTGFFQER